MTQVKMKKLHLQKKLQNVANLLLTVDDTIISVRLKLFELEKWKSNLVNKVHQCQIELMGLDSVQQNCSHDEDDKLSCITSTSRSESMEVDEEDDEDNHITSDKIGEQNSSSTLLEIEQNYENQVKTVETVVKKEQPSLSQQQVEVQEKTNKDQVFEDVKAEPVYVKEENEKTVEVKVHSEKIEEDQDNHSEIEIVSPPPPPPPPPVSSEVQVPFKRNLRKPTIMIIEQDVKNFGASNNFNKNNKNSEGHKTNSNADDDKRSHRHLEVLNNNNNNNNGSISSSTTSLKFSNGVENHHKITKQPKSSSSSSKVSVKSNHSKVSEKSNHSKVSEKSNHSKVSEKSNHSKVSEKSNHSKLSDKSNHSQEKEIVDNKKKPKNTLSTAEFKVAVSAFVSLERLGLASECDRFVLESRTNTWVPVKRTRRATKPRQPSQDIYSNSSSQVSNGVEAPKTHRRERTRGNEGTKLVKRRAAPIKQIQREKRIGQFRALDKKNTRKSETVIKQGVKNTKTTRGKGRPKLQHEVAPSTTITTTSTSSKNKVVKMRRENVKSKKAKCDYFPVSLSSQQKELKSNKQDHRDKYKETKKKRQIWNHAHTSEQFPILPINEVDDDDDDDDDDIQYINECIASESTTLIASAMTINHMGQPDVIMPTDEQYDPNYTGQEMWDELGKDYGQNKANSFQLDDDLFMCDQCGHRADSLADLKIHQVIGGCSVNVQDVSVSDLEFTQDMGQQSSNVVNMDIPFDAYRYGHLQSGDDIPVAFEEEVTQEDTVCVYEEVSEKVLVQPRDSNYMMWDGLLPESFNEVDVQTDSLQPPVVNGLLQVPTPRTTEYYHSLPIISPVEPFSHNNNHHY